MHFTEDKTVWILNCSSSGLSINRIWKFEKLGFWDARSGCSLLFSKRRTGQWNLLLTFNAASFDSEQYPLQSKVKISTRHIWTRTSSATESRCEGSSTDLAVEKIMHTTFLRKIYKNCKDNTGGILMIKLCELQNKIAAKLDDNAAELRHL